MTASKEAEMASLITSAPEYRPEDTRISISRGLADWMLAARVSLACTSYQTGQLFLVGVGPDGQVSFNEQNYARATGLHYGDGRLHVASMFQIWRLENMLKPGQFANNAFDMALVPRTAQTVGYTDAHELAVDQGGRLVFVNSRYSCLAIFDDVHSFRPIWKPPFISALAPEDRCHLNGLAMENGKPAYVTALAASDVKDGWRVNRGAGGIVVDVATGRIVTDFLSMPHSPRLHGGKLWVLDSGRGRIVTVDEQSGALHEVALCPGFLRGLAFHGDYAIVTSSRARDGGIANTGLRHELDQRGVEAVCGVLIVDLRSGAVVESIRFEGKIAELFDVAVLPDVRNPMSIGPATVEMIGAVSFEESFATLS